MRKRLGPYAVAFLTLLPVAWAAQKDKPEGPTPAPSRTAALTAEEREILNNRELLENLELLQNFEKIKYLKFFAEKKESKGKEKQGAKLPAKDNATKTIK